MRDGIAYVTKYMSKSKYPSKTQNLTLSLCWLFKKRSFAVSGDFQDLIAVLLYSNCKRFVQLDLLGSLIRNVHWLFVGVKSLDELKSEYPKLDFGSWSIELPYCAWDPDPKSLRGYTFEF